MSENDDDEVITSESWGGRLRESCGGILVGLLLFAVGIGLLVWNEGNFVKQHEALDEGQKIVVSVHSIGSINNNYEGKLVHITGTATTGDNISDPVFGVAPADALKLSRHVVMYQWEEHKETETKKKTGGSTETRTTYTYTKEWRSQVIESKYFHDPDNHGNPEQFPFPPTSYVADPIALGAYVLPQSVKDRINWFVPLHTGVSVYNIPDPWLRSGTKQYGYELYVGYDPQYPRIGDCRISYSVVPEQTISIVARQKGDTLSSYRGRSGGTFLLVESGAQDSSEMFLHADQSLRLQTWALRLLGFICIFLSLKLISQPVVVFSEFVPCFGSLVGFANDVVSLVVAFSITLVIIALAWLAYRPVFSLCLIGVAGIVIYLVKRRRNTSTEPEPYLPPPPEAPGTTDNVWQQGSQFPPPITPSSQLPPPITPDAYGWQPHHDEENVPLTVNPPDEEIAVAPIDYGSNTKPTMYGATTY